MIYVDEPNLYRCVFQSRKEEAQIFQDWVFEEVLPTIRRNGFFGSISELDIMREAYKIANRKNKQLERRIKTLTSPHAKAKSRRKQEVLYVSEWLKEQHINAVDEWCSDGMWIPMVELAKKYINYCVARRIRSLSTNMLGKELNRLGYKKRRRNGRSFYYVNK